MVWCLKRAWASPSLPSVPHETAEQEVRRQRFTLGIFGRQPAHCPKPMRVVRLDESHQPIPPLPHKLATACTIGFQGTYTWEDGRKYEGDFRHGKRDGKGTFLWSSGELFDGFYFHDRRDGDGVYTYRDGTKDAGVWKGKWLLRLSGGDKILAEREKAMKEDVLKMLNFKEHDGLADAAAADFSITNVSKAWAKKGGHAMSVSPWQRLRDTLAKNFDIAGGNIVGDMSMDDFVHRIDMEEMLVLLRETGQVAQFVVKGAELTAADIFAKLDKEHKGVIHLLDVVALLDMPDGEQEIKDCEAALSNAKEETKTKIKQGKIGEQKTHSIHAAEQALADKKKQVMIRDSFRKFVEQQTMNKDERFQAEMRARLDDLFVNADDGDRVRPPDP